MDKHLPSALCVLLLCLTAGCSGPDALHKAIRSGDVAKIKSLLAEGADANGVDKYGQTALTAAAYEGSPEIAELLISHGADANLCSHVIDGKSHVNQWPPIMALERHDRGGRGRVSEYAAVALLLIEKGADVNIKMHGGNKSPLHYATFRRQVTESLIQHGVNVNAKCKRGDTPLHDAIRMGHVHVIPVLLSAGADPTISNNEGKTPLDFARDEQRNNVVALIGEHIKEKGENPLTIPSTGLTPVTHNVRQGGRS